MINHSFFAYFSLLYNKNGPVKIGRVQKSVREGRLFFVRIAKLFFIQIQPRIFHSAARFKCPGKAAYLPATGARNDLHHIKPDLPLCKIWMFRQKLPCRHQNPPPLMHIHRFTGGSCCGICARFHLCDHNQIPAGQNQIQFAQTCRVMMGKQPKTQLLIVTGCDSLPLHPQSAGAHGQYPSFFKKLLR